MKSRSHSCSTGPTTSNCDRYSATFFHPLPSAISRLPRSSFSSITQSFFPSSWWNSLPKPPLPVQEYSNCFLNKENTTTQKKHLQTIHPNQKISPFFESHPAFLAARSSLFFASSASFFLLAFLAAFISFFFSASCLQTCQKLEDKKSWLDLIESGPALRRTCRACGL